ncbi:MAG: restriction endonuclease subunit S [Clostridia bacterium]|nr:restriction endonuclease subunit S [Clostridia bacterium]
MNNLATERTEYELGELLSYEQPTPYIVESTDYNDTYKTPVLTAGKSFILGNTNEKNNIYNKLPVIIFDDFTTASRYVNFPFKVKSSAMKILTPNTELVIPKYIYYRMQIIELDHSTHKRYWIQQFSKIKVAIPTITEQRRIVDRIEEMFSQLDSAVETLKKTKQQLAVYRQAVLKDAFESCKEYENYFFGDLMSTIRNGYGLKPDDNGSYKILKISAVRPLNLDFTECRFNNTAFDKDDLISENDILFTRYNGSREYVGVCAVVPTLVEQYAYPDKLIKCRPKMNNVIHSKFLAYYMSQGSAREYIRSKIKTTSGQNGIAGSDIKKAVVTLPNIDKQREIVKTIESRLSVCDSIQKTVDTALQQAEAMRQSILKKAFEGDLK